LENEALIFLTGLAFPYSKTETFQNLRILSNKKISEVQKIFIVETKNALIVISLLYSCISHIEIV